MNTNNTIITLWPDWSYSSMVAKNIISNGIDIEYSEVSKDIIEKIPKLLRGPIGNIDVIERIPEYMAWVIPMHNKYGRNVVFQPEALYDLKKNHPSTKILWWYSLQIQHVLATKKKNQKINKIYSHPQAILQCRKEIQKMENIETIATPSTTSQIEFLEDHEAVICNMQTAQKHNLSIINNQFAPSDNVTDFAVVTTQKGLTTASFQNLTQRKVLFILSLADEAGGLAHKLNILEKYNINMSSIHSHPNSEWWIDFPIIIENHKSIDIEWLKKEINIEII